MTEARKLPPPLPPRLDWFVQTQVEQLAQGGVPAWFHGAISREEAEDLLESQPLGSFLIRVSHTHVGYTLSYKAQSCCRHFMVKLLDDGSFVIPGEKSVHASLDALVTFHKQQPMRPHGELLRQPCGRIQQTWTMKSSSFTPVPWLRKLPAQPTTPANIRVLPPDLWLHPRRPLQNQSCFIGQRKGSRRKRWAECPQRKPLPPAPQSPLLKRPATNSGRTSRRSLRLARGSSSS
ncbi:hematopoietic SH2 domain-containing protein isoform X2 [Rhinolophus sinicus]|uniref:hematopoietic SH2 domain-containing protein isoform X2 n=1 Tax=Rhinolophus sinicus TaxID=89399 RepID=UPI003D7BF03E